MNNTQIKILAYIGFTLILLSVLNSLKIKLDWAILSGIPIAIPQTINWIDAAVNKKTRSVLELEDKYKAKDAEQDSLLKQALNIAHKTELTLSQLTKLQELYDRVSKCNDEGKQLKRELDVLDNKLLLIESDHKKFKDDFSIWFEQHQKRKWQK